MALKNNDKAAAEFEKFESLRPLQYSYGGKLIEVRYDENEQVMYSKDPQTGRIKKTAVDSKAFWENVSKNNTADPMHDAANPMVRENVSNGSKAPQNGNTAEADQSGASMAKPAPVEAPAKDAASDASDGAEQPSDAQGKTPYDESSEQRPPHSKKKVFILLVILLVVGTVLLRAGKIYWDAMPRETIPQESTAQTSDPTDEGTEPSESECAAIPSPTDPISNQTETVTVLTAKSTMLPGHVLIKNDFSTTEISAQEYQALTASGGYYKESDLRLLEGFVVVDYIPMDSCIRNDAIAARYAPVNPWGKTSERQIVVTLPVTVTPETLTSYLWGKSLDITVRTETKVELPASPQEDPPEEAAGNSPDGIQHESSTVEAIQADT